MCQEPDVPRCRTGNYVISNLSTKEPIMKILCVLYDDPKDGMPKSYPLSELPELKKYPDGMTLPTPKAIDFTPGE